MKQLITTIAILALTVSSAYAQEGKRHNDGWRDKVHSEKIAFFTAELGLTPEEAQSFWPVYNEYRRKCDEAHHNVKKAMFALDKKGENVSEKDMKKLVADYEAAFRKECEVTKDFPDYTGIISEEKKAKLYLAEEKFRMRMIDRLCDRHKPDSEKE